MALQYSTTHRTNNMSDLVTQVGASGVLKIFTGSPPSTCATADTGTLLSTHTCSATFGTVSSGVLTMNAIGSATAAATGTAGYFRIYPSSPTTTNAVIQGTVTVTAGGGDLTLNSTAISSGQTVQINTGGTITASGA